MPSAGMIAPVKKIGYETYVQNTSEYSKKLSSCTTVEEKFSAVREFLENGGLRTEKGAVSERRYSAALYFDKDISFQVGTKNVSSAGSQTTVPDNLTLGPGLYWFNYDTENGLTFYDMNSRDDIARVTIGGTTGSQIKAGANDQNLQVLFDSIKSTSALYANNREFATFMENVLDGLYGKGHAVTQHQGPYMANMQSGVGLIAVKRTLRGLLANLETKTLNDWTGAVYEMVNPTSTSGVGKAIIPTNQAQVSSIRDELKLSNDTVDNMYVGFDVKKGTPVMNVFTYLEVDRNKKYNPVLMYQIDGGTLGNVVNFDNSFSLQSTGKLITLRKDFDNSKLKGEAGIEGYLTTLFNQKANIVTGGDIYLFGSNVSADPGRMLKAYKAEFEKATP